MPYAVGNFGGNGNGVYAKYSWTDIQDHFDPIPLNEVAEKTVSLGQLAAGNHTLTIKLYDTVTNELLETMTRKVSIKELSSDPGDVLAAAKEIVFSSNKFSFTESIGNGAQAAKDIDLYSLTMSDADIGKTFIITTAPTSNKNRPSVWSILRLFNSAGSELQHSTASDLYGAGDAFLSFVPTAAGTYYIGVSAYDNTEYNPNIAGSGTAGSIGDYQFTVRRVDVPKADLSVSYDVSWYNPVISLTTANSTLPKTEFTPADNILLNFSFANIGDTAAADIKNRITIVGTNGYELTKDFTTATLAVGDIAGLPSDFSIGELATGTYIVTLNLNVGGIAETTRDNNVYKMVFTVAETDTLTAGKKDGTALTSSVTAAFAVEDFNRIEAKNSKGKIITTATSYIIKAYAWDAKTGKFKVAKTVTVKSTAANTVDGVLTYTLTGLKANTLYQITVQAKADAKTVSVNGSKTAGNPKGDVKTLGEVRTWAVVPNASLKASTVTENSVSVKVSNWGTSGGLWTQAVAKSAKVLTPIETDKATATVTKNISAVDTLLVTYSWSEVVNKKTIKHPTTATLTWDGESWSGSDVVSFDTAKGIITINGLSPSVKYTVQVQFSRSGEAAAVKATSVSVSTTARKFSAPVISNFQLTADKAAQVSFNLSSDVNGREATQYKVEFLTITNGKTKVAKTLTVDVNKTSDAWSFDGDSVTAYITGLTVYQVRVKALAAKKTSTYNYTNIASDNSTLSEKITT